MNPHHIHSTLAKQNKANCDLSPSLEMHGFTADVECHYSCKGDSNSKTKKVSRYFSPTEMNMRAGDGYAPTAPLMSSFTTVFMNWTSETCLTESISSCGSLDKVENSDFASISSGNWKLTEKPT